MRPRLVSSLLFVIAPSVQAGITVSSFTTTAGTSAFAPLDQSQYWDEHKLENVSPAIVDAVGDWIGPNYGGTTPTWHWVGSAHAESTTQFTPNSLIATGGGSFAWQLTTTSEFVSPSQSALLYGPGSGASYGCRFILDSSASYSLSAQLSKYTRLNMYSFTEGRYIFDQLNVLPESVVATSSGVIPPGDYSVGLSTGRGASAGPGASQQSYSGSFSNFLFTLQVAEPTTMMIMVPAAFLAARHRRRSGRDAVFTRP